jgi:signal transduction histidine kinase
MNIRTKLTVIFFVLVIIVVSIISLSIYYFSSEYREKDFYRRLKNRAINTAKLLTRFEEVNASLLQRMERENPANLPQQYVAIYDKANQVLYRSEKESTILIDNALLTRIQQESEVYYHFNEFEVLGFVLKDKENQFIIIAAASDINGRDALENLRDILLGIFAISVIIVSLLGWVFSGKVLSPIARIVNEVDSITAANLELRLDEGNRKDELSKLAQTFNKMLSRLQRAFFAQKNFIANASHEIKTPITVITGEIEVALLQRRTVDYYINLLKSVLIGIKGMNKLSTQLLLLAQTSADTPEKRFSHIRIDDILWSVKDELSKAHTDYTIDIEFDMAISDQTLNTIGDAELLKVVMLNLMENGCKYSDDNKVSVVLGTGKNEITIRFINKGIGILSDDFDKIFEPFFRGRRSKKIKGFGIGLPLAKRIMELHKGKILVSSVPNNTTAFTMVLPFSETI